MRILSNSVMIFYLSVAVYHRLSLHNKPNPLVHLSGKATMFHDWHFCSIGSGDNNGTGIYISCVVAITKVTKKKYLISMN